MSATGAHNSECWLLSCKMLTPTYTRILLPSPTWMSSTKQARSVSMKMQTSKSAPDWTSSNCRLVFCPNCCDCPCFRSCWWIFSFSTLVWRCELPGVVVHVVCDIASWVSSCVWYSPNSIGGSGRVFLQLVAARRRGWIEPGAFWWQPFFFS